MNPNPDRKRIRQASEDDGPVSKAELISMGIVVPIGRFVSDDLT
jgi:hypothetical protein